jgi:phosphopantothenoylcysteine decarboxylase/phosphopantothenate--cysteine ligase
MQDIHHCDIFISCAAVCDYSVKESSNQKIKKNGGNLILELIPNKDILANVCSLEKKPLCIGFAAETQNTLENAQLKLKNKGCEVIILNDVSNAEIGFNSDENQVIFISQKQQKNIAKNSKTKIANNILTIFIKEFL